MKIANVRIERYRGIDSLEIPLDPHLSVLYGPNGSGKTTVLTAIMMALAQDQEGPEFLRMELDQPVGSSEKPSIRLELRATTNGGLPRKRATVKLTPGTDMGKWRREVFPPDVLPYCSLHDIDRRVVSSLAGPTGSARTSYGQLLEWFIDEEARELRLQRDAGQGVQAEHAALSAVRGAICRMLHDVSNPRIAASEPQRLVVTVKHGEGGRDMAFDQLSDGYRGVIAVAADIAKRLATRTGATGNPLDAEMIVLIDEVELHLHPSWQQRILTDLRRTFPNAQFVVSTHSPQVLTTVQPRNIVELAVEDGRIVAGARTDPTYGAEAGDVLTAVMGVDERPGNDFSDALGEYMRLVGDDRGESEEALELRRQLVELSPGDPALHRADLEIRRRRMLREMGDS